MSDDAMRGLLGPVYDTTTPEQRDAISRAADCIEARWPDWDADSARREEINGALGVILGDADDESAAREALAARIAWLDAQSRLAGAIIAGAIMNPSEGEQPRAARLGIARDTVRKALGK